VFRVRLADGDFQETRAVGLERVHDHFRPAVAPHFKRARARRGQVVVGAFAHVLGRARVVAVSLQQRHVHRPVEYHVHAILFAHVRAHLHAARREFHLGHDVRVHVQV